MKTEDTILRDIYDLCQKLSESPKEIKILGQWDLFKNVYVIKHIPNYTTYELTTEDILTLRDCNKVAYNEAIQLIVCHLLLKPTPKENNEMFKKISDTEYENAVAAIQDEYSDKKRDAEAIRDEQLAKAADEHEKAAVRENADMWAYDLYARYNSLHEAGFAEELSIELLKLYISSKK